MRPLVESVPESGLADVLLSELFPRQEIDDTFVDIVLDDLEIRDPGDESEYAAYEVVRDAFATTEFVRARDTRYDQIVTVEFPRQAARDVHDNDSAQALKVSAPYERIAIEHDEEVQQLELEDLEIEHDFFARGDYAHVLPFPLYSAPFERVELGELLTPVRVAPDDSTELVVPHRATSARVVAIALVLACTIAVAIGVALLVVRSATV